MATQSINVLGNFVFVFLNPEDFLSSDNSELFCRSFKQYLFILSASDVDIFE